MINKKKPSKFRYPFGLLNLVPNVFVLCVKDYRKEDKEREMMKKLGAVLGLWVLVWLEDFDKETKCCIARCNTFGEWYAYRWLDRKVYLLPNGSVTGISYVQHWIEWKGNRRHIIFKDEQ